MGEKRWPAVAPDTLIPSRRTLQPLWRNVNPLIPNSLSIMLIPRESGKSKCSGSCLNTLKCNPAGIVMMLHRRAWIPRFFALVVLDKLMRPRTPIPSVVPSSAGGIQLEWHEKDIDLELHISAPYQCEMWFQDRRTNQAPLALDLTSDFAAVVSPIQQLTTR